MSAGDQEKSDFPFEAVRDLLGLVRGLYLAARERGATLPELRRIHRIGQELRGALDLAKSSEGRPARLAEALRRAAEATRGVGELVGPSDPARPIVRAVEARVRGRRGAA